MINETTAKYLIIGGIGLIFLGICFYFFHDKLHWLGNLPGDIKIENENSKIYLPLTTMFLISVVLNLLIYLFRKFS